MTGKTLIAAFSILVSGIILGGCTQPAGPSTTPADNQPAKTVTPVKTSENSLTIKPASETGSTQEQTAKLEIAPAAVSNKISIKDYKFNPETLTVPAGTEISWINQDSMPHSVISEKLFDSGIINNEASFSFTFKDKGTYDFHCGIHPSMKGIINVI